MPTIRKLKADEIEVKVKQVTEKGCLLLLYKTARTDRQILDEVFGAMNWTSDYKDIKGNLYCGIGCREDEEKPFVWKWDCGIESREDEEGNEKKGEASDAFKRAGFQWGIGVELYTSPFIWARVPTKQEESRSGKKIWVLENPYIRFSVAHIECDEETGKISKLLIVDNKGEEIFSFPATKKARSEFEKSASKEKSAATKALNKAVSTDTEYKKPASSKTLAERYGLCADFLAEQTEETFKRLKTSAIDSVNSLIDDLYKGGCDELALELTNTMNRLSGISADSIPE